MEKVQKPSNSESCACCLLYSGLCMTYKTGFGLDDWIYWHLIHTNRDYRQYSAITNPYTSQFIVAHSRVLSLHLSYPGNGFITVQLWLQITHEAFFSQPDSFLSIILQLPVPKTRLNSIPLLQSSYPYRMGSRNSTRLDSTPTSQMNCSL
jgi:hypothetical protein